MIIVQSKFDTPLDCPLTKSIAMRDWYTQPDVLHIPYHMPPGEPVHRSQERGPRISVLDQNLHEFRIAWDQRTNAPMMAANGVFGAKLLYLNAGSNTTWDLFFAQRMTRTAVVNFGMSSNAHPFSDLTVPMQIEQVIEYGRWYRYSLHVRLNTPGQRDGWIELSIDGVVPVMRQGKLVNGERPIRDLRDGCTLREDASPLKSIQWGMQIDRNIKDNPFDGEVVQDRFLRNVVVESL